MKILIVDDDRNYLEKLERQINRAIQVSTSDILKAQSYEQACSQIARVSDLEKLIVILDALIPRKKGENAKDTTWRNEILKKLHKMGFTNILCISTEPSLTHKSEMPTGIRYHPLPQGQSKHDFDSVINKLKEMKKANKEIGTGIALSMRQISLLKHRIAHLFLSMDVDLQGIGVLRRQVAEGEIQNAANTPEAYLRDVLNNKEKTDYYRQKLADLQFLVAKVSGGKKKPVLECDGEPSGEPAMPTLSESNFPDDKAIVNLILEEKRNNDSVVPFWNTLIALSGLKSEDEDKPFANIDPDTKSSIFIFMCLMDCKVDKNNINKQDVSDIMDYFDKIKDGKGWTVDGAGPSPIKCFNDWFCALVDSLEKLRKVIKPD